MRLIHFFEARKLTAWDLMAHYDVVDEAQATHDLMLPWVNNNRPGNISKMARDPKFRLAGQIRYYFEYIIGVRDMSKPATTVEHFEAALNQPIPLWRGGGGDYDAEYKSPRTWVSFTADERRVKTFSHYDGTHGGSSAGTRLQVRRDSWEIKLDLPLKDILLFLQGGGDSEIIVSKKDAKNAQLSESIILTELQEIGDPSQMTAMELRNQLEDNGWAKVDDGDTSYSNVYGKSGSPWVVKILKVSRRGSASTRFQCAMQWYRYCLKNWQNNPHLPRIPFVKTLRATAIGDDGQRKIAKGQVSYVVMLERLEDFYVDHYEWRREDPLNNAIMFSVMASVAGLYDHRWHNNDDMTTVFTTLLRIMTEEELQSLVSAVGMIFYDEHGGAQSEPGSDGWFASLTSALLSSGGYAEIGQMMERGIAVGAERGNPLAIAMEQIHKAGEDNGCEIDLHIGNVMVRPSTNELVITDPVQG